MATTKRTIEVELSTRGMDAQGRPQRVPLVVDAGVGANWDQAH